jgi:hypothetical protein
MSEGKPPIISEATKFTWAVVIAIIIAAVAWGSLTQKVSGIDDKVVQIQTDMNLVKSTLLNQNNKVSVK